MDWLYLWNLSSTLLRLAAIWLLCYQAEPLLRALRPFRFRNLPRYNRQLRVILYERVYLPYRSEFSLLVGWFRNVPPFECECCCLQLGSQDRDDEYNRVCRCAPAAQEEQQQYCLTCTSTFLSNQVTENQASTLVCMHPRSCAMDDRYVRRRLPNRIITLLDRNQILRAASSKERSKAKEKLWKCPAPDCVYIGFVSSGTRSNAGWGNYFLSRVFPATALRDTRRIRCPLCHIASCQFCANVWTRGRLADHTGISCAAHAAQLRRADANDDRALQQWKLDRQVQACPQCQCDIEKRDGCNHMTCRCGHEFCWVCGERWNGNHYRCRGRMPRRRHNNNTLHRFWTFWFGVPAP